MLEGVGEAGVVGIASAPGAIAPPSRSLSRISSVWRTTGVPPSGFAPVAWRVAALRALKVRAKAYVPGDLSGLDGVETESQDDHLQTAGISGQARLTTNVVLWAEALFDRHESQDIRVAQRRPA
jgi:hypothetical protein